MLNTQLQLNTDLSIRLQNEGQDDDPYYEGGIAVESAKPKLKPPTMYKVLMLNDDYTPMEFVVEVLQTFFNKSGEQATQIMLDVHNKGAAVCGIFTKDIAETKAAVVNDYSRECQYPLLCEVAPVEQ